MKFSYSRHCRDKKEIILERFFEIVPAAASWLIILGMLAFSFLKPLVAAVLIIAFELYWLLRLLYMLIFLWLSYLKLSVEKKADWNERISNVDNIDEYLKSRLISAHGSGLREKISLWQHRRQLIGLKRISENPPASRDIFHLVLIPIAVEPKKIIASTLLSIARSNFALKKILVVLAVEERAGNEVKKGAEDLREKYNRHFLDLLLIEHPDGLSGEARVKGANITYAAKQAEMYLEEKKISLDSVIVSCFDSDTIVSPDYFSCLTYNFLISPRRTRASFQPIPVYYNNIWDVPAFARVLDVGSSFFQLIEATNPEKLVTFSSHSMSFKALKEAGYWPVDMISDDSAIFWKAFLHYDGDYQAIPLYTTVSMDIAPGGSWPRAFINVYRQKRRWAWGVENFPIVMRAFLKNRRIPYLKKLRHSFKLFEGHISWATWPFILGIIGWLPAIFSGREFYSSVLYYSAPRIKAVIFNLASVGLVATSVLSICLLPESSARHSLLKRITHFFEWLLVPLISIFLSAIPALDAQTRLMRARYMEFWVTEKKRSN